MISFRIAEAEAGGIGLLSKLKESGSGFGKPTVAPARDFRITTPLKQNSIKQLLLCECLVERAKLKYE